MPSRCRPFAFTTFQARFPIAHGPHAKRAEPTRSAALDRATTALGIEAALTVDRRSDHMPDQKGGGLSGLGLTLEVLATRAKAGKGSKGEQFTQGHAIVSASTVTVPHT